MAKKIIFSTSEEVKRASNALKDFHIEHVLVNYPDKMFIVVMNKDLAEAKASLELTNISIRKVHGARRFEMYALQHTYHQPKFECVCRECGKKFMHVVKYAAWCSSDCKKKFRNARREERLNTKANEEAKQSTNQDSTRD